MPKLLAAGELKETPYRVVTKSGDIRDVLLSSTVERDAAGNVASIVGGLVDVTERKSRGGAPSGAEDRGGRSTHWRGRP